MTPEGLVKKAIKDVLQQFDVVPATTILPPGRMNKGWYYMPVSNGMGKHGIPDFIICYRYRFIAVEAKAPNGAPTPLQQLNQKLISNTGAHALITSNPEDLVTVLREIDEFLDN